MYFWHIFHHNKSNKLIQSYKVKGYLYAEWFSAELDIKQIKLVNSLVQEAVVGICYLSYTVHILLLQLWVDVTVTLFLSLCLNTQAVPCKVFVSFVIWCMLQSCYFSLLVVRTSSRTNIQLMAVRFLCQLCFWWTWSGKIVTSSF